MLSQIVRQMACATLQPMVIRKKGYICIKVHKYNKNIIGLPFTGIDYPSPWGRHLKIFKPWSSASWLFYFKKFIKFISFLSPCHNLHQINHSCRNPCNISKFLLTLSDLFYNFILPDFKLTFTEKISFEFICWIF